MSKNTILLLSITLFALFVGAASGLFYGRLTTRQQILSLIKNNDLQLGSGVATNKLESALRLIDGYYIDTIKIDTLIEPLMSKVIERLDPHSAYIPAKDMSRYNEALEGEFDGIGVVFNMATDTVIVLNVIVGGASSRAGVIARDRIIMIDDTLVAGKSMDQEDIVRRLRGPRGTKVVLGLERSGIDDLVSIEVTRDKVPINSISSSFMIQPEVGYICLDQFSRTTYREFITSINDLKSQGMERLIFDIRGNSGGFLDQAILLAGEFLPKDALIVYTEDREGRQERQFNNREGSLQGLDVAVLIDESSASSSEILAGALQDNDVGVIIGRRSFGKGLIQQQIPFNDGSAIRLTIARYYTPTGRSIQKPYTKGDGKSYEEEIYTRYLHSEHISADSISFNDSLRFTTPKGKVVYGGGGIMPDIFVAADTTAVSDYYLDVARRNILYRYTTVYADAHRQELNSARTKGDLDRMFGDDSSLLNGFIQYAKSEGVAPVTAEIKRSRTLLISQLKAYIARNSPLEEAGYYTYIYPPDIVMQTAVELLTL